jgi:hypothetical protein
MTEQTKHCSKCDRDLPLSKFGNDRQKKDGLSHWCKECRAASERAYAKTEAGKATRKRASKKFNATEKGKAAMRRANKSEAAKRSREKYYASPKAAERLKRYLATEAGAAVKKRAERNYLASEYGKQHRREYQIQYTQTERGKRKVREAAARMRAKYPERISARKRIAQLVADGKMPPARDLVCQQCDRPATEYHHHLGYDVEHWLDVVPLCRSCHEKADQEIAA